MNVHNTKKPLLKYTLQFLSVAGLNPLLGNRLNWRDIFSTITLISTVLLVMLTIKEITVNWNEENTFHSIVFLPGLIMTIIKQLVMMLSRRKLKNMIRSFDEFWPSNKFSFTIDQRMQTIYQRGYNCIKTYFGCLVVNCVSPLYSVLTSEERITMLLSYRLCNLDNDFCYGGYFVWQCFAMVTIMAASVGFDMLFIVFVTYVYVALEMVKEAFSEMNFAQDEKIPKDIEGIVRQHNIILGFINEFNEFMTLILGIQFSMAVFSIMTCWLMLMLKGFAMDIETFSNYGFHSFSLIMQIFLYNFGGALIYDQALSVSDAAYTADWYLKGRTTLRKDLSFIILRSQQVASLRIGFVYDLNLVAFVETLRLAFSVATLFETIASKSDIF